MPLWQARFVVKPSVGIRRRTQRYIRQQTANWQGTAAMPRQAGRFPTSCHEETGHALQPAQRSSTFMRAMSTPTGDFATGFTGHAASSCPALPDLSAHLVQADQYGKAQRIGTSPYSITFIAGGTVGRAHHPAGKLAACAAIVIFHRPSSSPAALVPPIQNCVHSSIPAGKKNRDRSTSF